MAEGITRRDMLKLPALAAGGLALASAMSGCTGSSSADSGSASSGGLQTVTPPLPALSSDQMRIIFLGTSCVPRTGQECNSIFVEVGSGDQFIFDCGSGVVAKYGAMGIPFSRMDKIFLTHLHGDHMSDLTHIYAFGPSGDRKTALKIWGPSRSNMTNPTTGENPNDGTAAFCAAFQQFMAWHVQAFSFLQTGFGPRGSGNNGYDIQATELDWTATNLPTIYNQNGVTITYWPAVHDRNGSISYKLTYNKMSMVFSGDTKPNDYMTTNAKGVDVLIHEMVVPPEIWAAKNSGLQPGQPGWTQALQIATNVQDNSHTPQKAFGYIMNQTKPRLAVVTHFQVNDDTVGPAMADITYWYKGPVAFATDLLVLTVSPSQILQQQAVIDPYAWLAPGKLSAGLYAAEYPTPYSQLDQNILLNHCIPVSTYSP
ncbi:MAG: Ribonuclease BN [Syntrophorhabdaceae bacterium PtaU1.Bin034]|nr:MAG: Ribonuclease BN [Syntrophorhabdaceae bacterium PtaU1.Bin034]